MVKIQKEKRIYSDSLITGHILRYYIPRAKSISLSLSIFFFFLSNMTWMCLFNWLSESALNLEMLWEDETRGHSYMSYQKPANRLCCLFPWDSSCELKKAKGKVRRLSLGSIEIRQVSFQRVEDHGSFCMTSAFVKGWILKQYNECKTQSGVVSLSRETILSKICL